VKNCKSTAPVNGAAVEVEAELMLATPPVKRQGIKGFITKLVVLFMLVFGVAQTMVFEAMAQATNAAQAIEEMTDQWYVIYGLMILVTIGLFVRKMLRRT